VQEIRDRVSRAVKEMIPDHVVMIPTGRFVVKDSDVLVMLGPNRALAELSSPST
jgi:trk system potassium uptake protein TrkA